MNRFESRTLKAIAAGAALAAALLAFAPNSSAAELRNGVEATFGFSYYSIDDESNFDFSSVGARYHHDWNDRWGIEASYIHQDQQDIDAEILEVSARFTLFQNERIRLFGVGGVGALSYDYRLFIGEDALVSGSDDAPVFHVGIAADISLGERLYLRPDLRFRRAVDIFAPYDESTSEATLAFGYRF